MPFVEGVPTPSITVGFEDLTGGGDQDYEDVVFRVEVIDEFVFG